MQIPKNNFENIENAISRESLSFPWHVKVKGYNLSQSIPIDRNGVLISTSWVLTTAISTLNYTSAQVYLGYKSSGSFTISRKSFRIIEHPELVDATSTYFLSLIKLAESVPISSIIRPIRLSKRSQSLQSLINSNAYLSTLELHKSVSTLKYSIVTVVDTHNCKMPGVELHSERLCAVSSNKQTLDYGDCGGGLVLQESDGWTLIGILTVIQENNIYACYEKISYYIDWIEQYTGIKARY